MRRTLIYGLEFLAVLNSKSCFPSAANRVEHPLEALRKRLRDRLGAAPSKPLGRRRRGRSKDPTRSAEAGRRAVSPIPLTP